MGRQLNTKKLFTVDASEIFCARNGYELQETEFMCSVSPSRLQIGSLYNSLGCSPSRLQIVSLYNSLCHHPHLT